MDSTLDYTPAAILMLDLKRELERRSRGGMPFSLVQLRVNDAADKIRILQAYRSITRVFDDIYEYTHETDLLLSLKHCDSKGAFRFIDRLKHKLQDLGFGKLMFESCVVEPIPGDALDDLLKNVGDDLNKLAAIGAGDAGQYHDISPLKRYVDGLK